MIEAEAAQYTPEDLRAFVEHFKNVHWPLCPREKVFPATKAYLEEKYAEGPPYALGGPWTGAEELVLDGASDNLLMRSGKATWRMECDAGGKVAGIDLSPEAVGVLFDAADMSGEEFAQSFMGQYGLPAMDTKVDTLDPAIIQLTGRFQRRSWVYADRDNGWIVAITEGRQLLLWRL